MACMKNSNKFLEETIFYLLVKLKLYLFQRKRFSKISLDF